MFSSILRKTLIMFILSLLLLLFYYFPKEKLTESKTFENLNVNSVKIRWNV